MKKILFVAAWVLLFSSVTACRQQDQILSDEDTQNLKVLDNLSKNHKFSDSIYTTNQNSFDGDPIPPPIK